VLVDRQRGNERYWSPTFCGVSDEKRDNTNVVLKGNYFLSTGRGAHNLVFGYDTFNDNRLSNNHQAGSDYTVAGTTSIIQGASVYPVFQSGDQTTFIQANPIFVDSLGTNFRTHSVFFNDSLRYSHHFSFNLGARWDRNQGADAGGNLVARDSALSPRLGMVWDLRGDGVWAVNASFSKYVTAIANSIAGWIAQFAERARDGRWRESSARRAGRHSGGRDVSNVPGFLRLGSQHLDRQGDQQRRTVVRSDADPQYF
jgi:outer membrane receptor protein involved in Fe transport